MAICLIAPLDNKINEKFQCTLEIPFHSLTLPDPLAYSETEDVYTHFIQITMPGF